MYCCAIIMLRTIFAAWGIRMSRASSTDWMDANACTVVQTPQARWVNATLPAGPALSG